MRKYTSAREIRLAFVIPVLAILAALSVFLYSIFFYSFRKTLEKELRSKGSAVAKTLSTSAESSLVGRDSSTLQGFLDEYKKIDGVEYVFVINEKDEVLAHTFSPKIPDEIMRANPALENASKIRIQTLSWSGSTIIDIGSPIMGGVLGTVRVGMNLSEVLNNALKDTMVSLLLVTLVMMAISGFVVYFKIYKLSREVFQYNSQLVKTSTELETAKLHVVHTSKMTALGEMAGGIAHEINNPLTILMGNAHQGLKIIKTQPIDSE